MIRVILFAAIGFYLSRRLYERYDKQQAMEKENVFRRRVKVLLKREGLSAKTISQLEKELFKNNEQ